jgi:hypothetical protein
MLHEKDAASSGGAVSFLYNNKKGLINEEFCIIIGIVI